MGCRLRRGASLGEDHRRATDAVHPDRAPGSGLGAPTTSSRTCAPASGYHRWNPNPGAEWRRPRGRAARDEGHVARCACRAGETDGRYLCPAKASVRQRILSVVSSRLPHTCERSQSMAHRGAQAESRRNHPHAGTCDGAEQQSRPSRSQHGDAERHDRERERLAQPATGRPPDPHHDRCPRESRERHPEIAEISTRSDSAKERKAEGHGSDQQRERAHRVPPMRPPRRLWSCARAHSGLNSLMARRRRPMRRHGPTCAWTNIGSS